MVMRPVSWRISLSLSVKWATSAFLVGWFQFCIPISRNVLEPKTRLTFTGTSSFPMPTVTATSASAGQPTETREQRTSHAESGAHLVASHRKGPGARWIRPAKRQDRTSRRRRQLQNVGGKNVAMEKVVVSGGKTGGLSGGSTSCFSRSNTGEEWRGYGPRRVPPKTWMREVDREDSRLVSAVVSELARKGGGHPRIGLGEHRNQPWGERCGKTKPIFP